MKKQILSFTVGLLLCLMASAEDAEKQTNSADSSVAASDSDVPAEDVNQTTTTKKVKKSKAKGVKAANMATDNSSGQTVDRVVVEDTHLTEGSNVGPTNRRKENLNRNNDMTASGTTQPRSTY